MLADIISRIAGMKAEEEWEDVYRPRPSMAGPERCIRSMVYHGLGVPKSPWPGRMVLTVDDSSWHETLTLDWLRQSAFQVHSEQMEIDCPAPMGKGHIDGIVTDLLGVDRLLEHKAINHFTFQKHWNNDELPLDYFTQCAIYMNGLQAVNPDIFEGILLVKNKNTSAYLEYLFNYSGEKTDVLLIIKKTNSNGETKEIKQIEPDIVSSAIEKFNQVQKYIETNTLPKRPYEIDSWRCDYCVSGDTLVKMAIGTYKKINKIKRGDIVAGIDASTKVIQVIKSEQQKKWVKIKPMGMLDIKCTEDHEFLVGLWSSREKFYQDDSFLPTWIKASDLTIGSTPNNRPIQTVLVPVHQPFNNSLLTEEEVELLGYYTAEGCLANFQDNQGYYRVEFTLNENEKEIAKRISFLAKKIFNCNAVDKVVQDKREGQETWRSRRISCSSKKMADFVRSHVKGTATIKQLSASIMGLPLHLVEVFLNSAWRGDGFFNEKQWCVGISTSSRGLCLQYQQLFWRLNIPAIAQYANRPGSRMGYKCSQGYRVQTQGLSSIIRFVKIGNRAFASAQIKNRTSIEPETCWDIEVSSPHHVFVTDAGIVHNCGWGRECWKGYEKEFAEMKTNSDLPNEIADTVRFYKELGAQKSEIEKQYKELSGKVKSIMKELNVREGRAGEYVCKLSLNKVDRIDKELLTEVERLRATVTTMQERLTVSSPARKENQ